MTRVPICAGNKKGLDEKKVLLILPDFIKQQST